MNKTTLILSFLLLLCACNGTKETKNKDPDLNVTYAPKFLYHELEPGDGVQMVSPYDVVCYSSRGYIEEDKNCPGIRDINLASIFEEKISPMGGEIEDADHYGNIITLAFLAGETTRTVIDLECIVPGEERSGVMPNFTCVEKEHVYTASDFVYPHYTTERPSTNTVTLSAVGFAGCRDYRGYVVDLSNCEMPVPAPTKVVNVFALTNNTGATFSDYTVIYDTVDDTKQVLFEEIIPGETVYGYIDSNFVNAVFADNQSEQCLLSEVLSMPTTPISLRHTFKNCDQLVTLPAGNLVIVDSMERAFEGATNFNANISGWDVSAVVNFSSAFSYTKNFNSNIGNWNIDSAKDMSYMFSESNFNSMVGYWGMGSVTDVTGMFFNAVNFNQDLSAWSIHVSADRMYFSDGSALTPGNLPSNL